MKVICVLATVVAGLALAGTASAAAAPSCHPTRVSTAPPSGLRAALERGGLRLDYRSRDRAGMLVYRARGDAGSTRTARYAIEAKSVREAIESSLWLRANVLDTRIAFVRSVATCSPGWRVRYSKASTWGRWLLVEVRGSRL